MTTTAPLVISSNTVLPRIKYRVDHGPAAIYHEVFAPILMACKPGDSFFLPTSETYRTTIHLHNYASAQRKSGKNVRLTVRTVVENHVRGLRVWRII